MENNSRQEQLGVVQAKLALFLAAAAKVPRGADHAKQVWQLQYDHGLAWVDFPEGLGGLGVSSSLRGYVGEKLSGAGIRDAAAANAVGVDLVAPVLVALGSHEQQERHLQAMFTGDDIWCQLFSEPNAGSDLAALGTRAVRREDGCWVVTGQKVWTTLGHIARWGILCARTDPDAPKHKGITCFIVDMSLPGIQVRPIRQLTGDAEFNEVFLEQVVLPETAVVGTVNEGWAAVLATLANERAVFADEPLRQGEGAIGDASKLWGRAGNDHPELLDRYMSLWTRAEAVRLAALEAVALEEAQIPSSAWSYLKIARSELDQEIYDFCVSLLGVEGLEYPSYEMRQPMTMDEMRREADDVRREWLFARCATIAGGTSEVQRTIIADRVLGLPREASVDRRTPWRELRKN